MDHPSVIAASLDADRPKNQKNAHLPLRLHYREVSQNQIQMTLHLPALVLQFLPLD